MTLPSYPRVTPTTSDRRLPELLLLIFFFNLLSRMAKGKENIVLDLKSIAFLLITIWNFISTNKI